MGIPAPFPRLHSRTQPSSIHGRPTGARQLLPFPGHSLLASCGETSDGPTRIICLVGATRTWGSSIFVDLYTYSKSVWYNYTKMHRCFKTKDKKNLNTLTFPSRDRKQLSPE